MLRRRAAPGAGGSHQLVVQAERAVVLQRVRARVQGGGQRQRQRVPVGQLPDTRTQVAPEGRALSGGRGQRRGRGG